MKLPPEVIQGMVKFMDQEYYDAHEYFETAWRETPDSSREFYRALLHISGGFFRLTQDRPQAARKFFLHAIKWLETFPCPYQGFDTAEIKRLLFEMIEEIKSESGNSTLLEYQSKFSSTFITRKNL